MDVVNCFLLFLMLDGSLDSGEANDDLTTLSQ
jgi:hypothetical protein